MKPYYDDGLITIYCADWRDIVPAVAFDVVVTDPPYGVAYEGGRMYSDGRNRSTAFGGRLDRTTAPVAGDDSTDERDALLDAIGDRPAVVFGTGTVKAQRPHNTARVLIWDKQGHYPGLSPAPWYTAHEEIYLIGVGWVGPPTRSVLSTTEHRSHQARTHGHPTTKPVPLMRALLEKCPPGVVLDPFAGSGSTLRAAKDLGRRAIGVEIVEAYAERAARRCAQEVLDLGGAS